MQNAINMRNWVIVVIIEYICARNVANTIAGHYGKEESGTL